MYKTLVKAALFLLVAVYIADCFSPLRLHVDTVRYYAIMDCIQFGCPVNSDAATDYFPYGYTALLLLFSKMGILKHFPIIFINVIYLLGGLYFLYKTFRSRLNPYSLFVVVMLNWLFVKFTDHPLSELQYIFFSLGSVYFYSRFAEDRKVTHLLVALVMGWIAFMTRTIGITLLGALGVDLLWKYKEQQLDFFRRNKLLVSGILVVLVGLIIVFSKIVGIDHYGGVLRDHFKEAPLFRRIGWRFKEWGEIFVNTPSNKVIDRLAGWPGEVLFMVIGLAFFAWFMFVLFLRKNAFPLYLKLYLAFYCLLLFNWPFNDPRFWLPVMPLMAAIVLLAATPATKAMKWGKAAYVAVYAALGIFSAGYMVYSSFDREFLAHNQAKGAYRNEYETHWYGRPQSDTARKMDTLALHVLEKYD
jgi:hypothetical protein